MSFTIGNKQLSASKCTPLGNNRTFPLTFQVRSSAASNVIAVTDWLTSGGSLPVDLTAYGNADAKLSSIQAVPVGDAEGGGWRIFDGTATYEQIKSSQANDDSAIPTGDSIRFGQNTYEKVKWKAKNAEGKEVSILNSAGSHFSDAVMEIEKRLVIIVEKTYARAVINPADFANYFNSVNLNALRIADVPIIARGGHMMAINPTVYKTESSYQWRIAFEIEVMGNGLTYDREVLDQGYTYLKSIGYVEAAFLRDEDPGSVVTRDGEDYVRSKVRVQDAEGNWSPATDPVLLDGNGGLLADATPGNEVYLTFRTKPERPWERLGFPSTVAAVYA